MAKYSCKTKYRYRRNTERPECIIGPNQYMNASSKTMFHIEQ